MKKVRTCVHVQPPCTRKLEAAGFVIIQCSLQHFIFEREKNRGINDKVMSESRRRNDGCFIHSGQIRTVTEALLLFPEPAAFPLT